MLGPRILFLILSHHDAPNIRPVRLTHIFHFLGVFASGNLRGIIRLLDLAIRGQSVRLHCPCQFA